MKIILTTTLATAALFAATTHAQIAHKDVLISEKTSKPIAPALGMSLLDLNTGKARVIQNLTGGGYGFLALDQRHPQNLWALSSRPSAGRMPTFDHLQLNGDTVQTYTGATVDFGLFGRVERVHVYKGDLLYALSGSSGGLYRKARGASRSDLLYKEPAPRDIAILGDKIYLSTMPATGASQLVEIDMSGSQPVARTLKLVLDPQAPSGAKLPQKINCMTAYGPEGAADRLAVADDKGVIYMVIPGQAGHNVETTNQPGQAEPRAIAWHPRATMHLLIATKDKVFDRLNYMMSQGKPLYTSASEIHDLSASAGYVGFFGTGSLGSNGKRAAMVYGTAPYTGNTSFAIKLRNAAPNAMARLLIGSSNKAWIGGALPMDLGVLGAPGAKMLVSPDLILGVGTDARGEIHLPVALPNDPKLIGYTSYLQFGFADPKANAAGLSTSNAMEVVFR